MDGPNFRLDGKIALVTGAGRGIGLAISQALASVGCAVAIQDIEVNVAAAEADKIVAAGGRAVALGGDMTDLSVPKSLVDQTVAELGGLHILVNNAAVQVYKPNWLDLTVAEIDIQLRADFTSPILLCQLAAPIFKSQKFGRIINIGSIQGKVGTPGMLAYSMCKAAMQNLTLALAKELGPDGVTVNLLAPGFFNTWRNREQFTGPDDVRAEHTKWLPIQRAGLPDDFAGIAVFLASDTSAYVTGQLIGVDGGMSAR